MEPVDCGQVRAWVERMLGSHAEDILPAGIAAHVSSCASCRGALALMVITALELRDGPAALSCEACEEELATLLDLEADEGSPAAARRLPQVWWHVWSCAECAEVYERVRRVIRAEPASVKRRLAVSGLLRIERSFLHIALPRPQARLGSARGGAAEEVVLAVQEQSEPHYRVSVRRIEQGQWRFTVRVAPAPIGWVVFSLGEASFRAPFNPQGEAVVSEVPDALLAARDGPDLDISIEEIVGG